MPRGPYQIEVGAAEAEHDELLRRMDAWCIAWGVPFCFYRPTRSRFGARLSFEVLGIAEAFRSAFGGRLLTGEEIAAVRSADDEADELDEAENAHFDEYVLYRAPEGFWDR